MHLSCLIKLLFLHTANRFESIFYVIFFVPIILKVPSMVYYRIINALNLPKKQKHAQDHTPTHIHIQAHKYVYMLAQLYSKR